MTFSDIVGHTATVTLLQRVIASGKVAHAYLFCGPDGCGKRTVARAFVSTLFCNSGATDACAACPTCRKLAAGSHPDLHGIEPDGTYIKIEQVRTLQREMSLRPYEAPRKACIIDGADRFHPAAANALLKTLEEPPGNAIMILVSNNPAAVLPTIVSRCQQVNFQGLATQTIEEALCRQGIARETAAVAATLADGSLTQALSLSDGDMLAGREPLCRSVTTLTLKDMATLFTTAEHLSADKERLPRLLDLLASFYRDVLLMLAGSGEVTNQDLIPLLTDIAGRSTTAGVTTRLERIMETRQALQRNVNTRLAIDRLLINLAA